MALSDMTEKIVDGDVKPQPKQTFKQNFIIYEGCQESSWTHMITASNVPDFDIHYYFSLK